jgi:hypothetical protein
VCREGIVVEDLMVDFTGTAAVVGVAVAVVVDVVVVGFLWSAGCACGCCCDSSRRERTGVSAVLRRPLVVL